MFLYYKQIKLSKQFSIMFRISPVMDKTDDMKIFRHV